MFDSFLRTLGYVKKSAESDHPIKNILSYRVKYEYFKEAHEFEIERRERLNSRISLLTTSLAAGAGFVAYYSHGPLPMENGTSMLICALECTAGIYSLFMAAWQSWKVIEEREYAYPPTAEKIRDFLGELEEYNSQVSAMEQEDVESAYCWN